MYFACPEFVSFVGMSRNAERGAFCTPREWRQDGSFSLGRDGRAVAKAGAGVSFGTMMNMCNC